MLSKTTHVIIPLHCYQHWAPWNPQSNNHHQKKNNHTILFTHSVMPYIPLRSTLQAKVTPSCSTGWCYCHVLSFLFGGNSGLLHNLNYVQASGSWVQLYIIGVMQATVWRATKNLATGHSKTLPIMALSWQRSCSIRDSRQPISVRTLSFYIKAVTNKKRGTSQEDSYHGNTMAGRCACSFTSFTWPTHPRGLPRFSRRMKSARCVGIPPRSKGLNFLDFRFHLNFPLHINHYSMNPCQHHIYCSWCCKYFYIIT